MNEELLLETIVGVVPQWFQATCGPNSQALRIGENWYQFYTHRSLTPELIRLKEFAQEHADYWLDLLSAGDLPGLPELIQECLAQEWLEIKGPTVSWRSLLGYAHQLRERTYENQLVQLNLVICEGTGTAGIASADFQKLLDPLASSRQVYFRVDPNLQFISYDEIAWSEIRETDEYKFSPEFLQPFASTLLDGEYSFHQTSRGDLVFMDSMGILAAKRKGRWNLYDVATFKNCLADILGNYRVGANLFEVVFDLSYRRHGALLVYDPGRKVVEQIVNKESILPTSCPEPSTVPELLTGSIRSISLGQHEHAQRKKRLFLEIASLDGAVVFDQNQVLAFGAMIMPHPEVGNFPGARTTAAQSAFKWGSSPVKISSDGDISFLFHSRGLSNQRCDVVLNFL